MSKEDPTNECLGLILLLNFGVITGGLVVLLWSNFILTLPSRYCWM